MSERIECPNCGEDDNLSEDEDKRICWECGKRWTPEGSK